MIADFWDVSWIKMVSRKILPGRSVILPKGDYIASLQKDLQEGAGVI